MLLQVTNIKRTTYEKEIEKYVRIYLKLKRIWNNKLESDKMQNTFIIKKSPMIIINKNKTIIKKLIIIIKTLVRILLQ